MMSRTLVAILMGSAGLFASPTLAHSAKAVQAAPPLSKPVSRALAAVQRLQAEGDHKGALAKIAEVEALPSLSRDDIYFTAAAKSISANATNNAVLFEETLNTMLSTGKIAAADQPNFLKNLGFLALGRKDYKTAIKHYEQLLALDPNDTEVKNALKALYSAQ